jgi:hypothetical protein
MAPSRQLHKEEHLAKDALAVAGLLEQLEQPAAEKAKEAKEAEAFTCKYKGCNGKFTDAHDSGGSSKRNYGFCSIKCRSAGRLRKRPTASTGAGRATARTAARATASTGAGRASAWTAARAHAATGAGRASAGTAARATASTGARRASAGTANKPIGIPFVYRFSSPPHCVAVLARDIEA